MLRLLGLLLWCCMNNLILNQDALPPSCFSHVQATLFYCLVHPLVGNTRCCHHPHQKNQNWLRQSVPVTMHSIDERENTQLRLSAKRRFQRQLSMLLDPSSGI